MSFECDKVDDNFSDTIIVESSLAVTSKKNDYIFNFFPNPVSEYLNFVVKNSDNILLSIIDMKGQVHFSEQFKGHTGNNYKKIDLRNLNRGVYILMLQINNDTIRRTKIVKL